MTWPFPRLAVRALLVEAGRILLVNAYPGGRSDLWCAPGGGVERGVSLPENLAREVREETGLEIAAGPLALVNEFHDPRGDFHQVEMFFRCRIVRGTLDPGWRDPDGIVTERRFLSPDEAARVRIKPDSLVEVAFAPEGPARYDPLEPIVG